MKDYQLSFDGDVAHGQFLTQVAGKDVWRHICRGIRLGKMVTRRSIQRNSKLEISMFLFRWSMTPLQKKLAEQRDRLKLPDGVGGMKVENGELVMTQK